MSESEAKGKPVLWSEVRVQVWLHDDVGHVNAIAGGERNPPEHFSRQGAIDHAFGITEEFEQQGLIILAEFTEVRGPCKICASMTDNDDDTDNEPPRAA